MNTFMIKCCQRCAHTKLIYRTICLNLVANYGVKSNTQHTTITRVKEIVSIDNDVCLQLKYEFVMKYKTYTFYTFSNV